MLLYWIWLAEVKHINLQQKHRLLERFGDPENVYHHAELSAEQKNLQPAQEILQKCKDKRIGILPISDRAYSARLRNTAGAPLVLYYKGTLPDWESVPFIGIVGTRKASAYGLQVARQMGAQIAACGGFVVSGAAEGGDAAAMWGALSAGCPVVGVLGCGVDVVYPYCNRKLFQEVAERGCLISEYPPGEKALRWHFPARNRIISGLSNGVLVVEAPKQSGTLITARYALEQGRDIFVVPGNIDNLICQGSNELLQDGATPVFSGWDVVSCYEFLYPGKIQKHKREPLYTGEYSQAKVAQEVHAPTAFAENTESTRKKSIDNPSISTYSVVENAYPALTEEEQAVLAQLTRQPREPAELIDVLTLPAGVVLSALTMLTVKGLVNKHPGGRVSLK